MEIMNILVKLIVCMAALLVSNTAAQSGEDGSGCPGGVRYTVQPPTELNCNPMGIFLQLFCLVDQDNGHSNVTWYWSRCVHDAGINGTAIEPGDTSDAYGVLQRPPASPFSNITLSFVIFQATNATLGYYWCEIDSAEYSFPLRSSVITPVLQPTNASLPACVISYLIGNHNSRSGPECAAEGSPIVYPRKPLPSFCPSVTPSMQPVSCNDTMLSSDGALPLTVLAGSGGTLFIILVLVIVILSVCLCCKRRQLGRTKKKALEVPNPHSDQLGMIKEDLTKA